MSDTTAITAAMFALRTPALTTLMHEPEQDFASVLAATEEPPPPPPEAPEARLEALLRMY